MEIILTLLILLFIIFVEVMPIYFAMWLVGLKDRTWGKAIMLKFLIDLFEAIAKMIIMKVG